MQIQLPTQFINEALTPAAKEVGATLGNIFYLIFHPINHWPSKLRIKYEHDLKEYQKSLEKEVSKVPEDKLIDPQLSIVGPALEASKYHIADTELRSLFAKLVASSMNADKIHHVHPSFVEIIKQMSPLDAQNLKFLKVNGKGVYPIARYKLSLGNTTSTPEMNLMLKPNDTPDDLFLNASSIDNLVRLGMLRTDYSQIFTDDTSYMQYQTALSLFSQSPYAMDLQKGVLELTALGRDFLISCIE